MTKNYYCLVAGLPDILLGDKKVLYNSLILREELSNDLEKKDFEKAQALYFPFDHYNLISLLYQQHKEFDPRGVYTSLELEELTDKKNIEGIDKEKYPGYLIDFVTHVLFAEEKVPIVEAELLLFRKYVNYLQSFSNEFLNNYIDFEINIKNVLTALNGRKYEVSVEHELLGKGEIVEALVKSRSRDFGLANELEYVDSLIQIHEEENLMERELKIDRLKWEYLDETTFFHYFTIEKVLAFIYKLLIVERWISLDEEEGRKLFQQLVSELENSYEFPEEYKLSHGKKK
ncbi:DUF2764 family protein [Plebeiibacterium marinum]|uniref:DUF2764 domain-containing protein n=1 Tax=Plebeiibacterium marinum TaxID=2992111 RepID=A0AAE3SJE5_9BACT|nr:DUF2764 family protein [Plebeiobacterium marinum]MCW3805313.1 DUF2764 domain-containing protein [Plebeiobacterium marinum]